MYLGPTPKKSSSPFFTVTANTDYLSHYADIWLTELVPWQTLTQGQQQHKTSHFFPGSGCGHSLYLYLSMEQWTRLNWLSYWLNTNSAMVIHVQPDSIKNNLVDCKQLPITINLNYHCAWNMQSILVNLEKEDNLCKISIKAKCSAINTIMVDSIITIFNVFNNSMLHIIMVNTQS